SSAELNDLGPAPSGPQGDAEPSCTSAEASATVSPAPRMPSTCPTHGEPLAVPCTRCGDFTCRACAAPFGAKPICAGCVERVAGDAVPTRVRLDHWEPGPEWFPAVCPNCLATPALVPLRIARGGAVRSE